MKKFKKAIRIVLTVAVVPGAVFAIASNVTPSVVFGCDTADC